MKRFLFDTWYGALALWGGACVVFLAFPALDVFLPGRLPRALDVCLGRTSFVLALLSGILFFVAWLVSLARRRWRRALLQAFLGLGLLVCVLCAFFAILIAADLGVGISEDHFADSLTIPPEMEAGLVVPGQRIASSFSTPEVYEDDFARAIFAALSTNDGKDASITCDLSSLAGLVRDRRADLMAYLARHPGWWLHEYRGRLCATRRLNVRGVWNHPMHGYYDGGTGGADFPRDEGNDHYQTRTTICFPVSPLSRKGADHPAVSSIQAKLSAEYKWQISCERFGDDLFCVEVFEETPFSERRMTKAALAFLADEFASLTNLPPDTVTRGPESFVLRDSLQPGIYNLTLRINPGEPGMTYLKAFEATKGTPLSESGLKENSNERIGWSDDSEEKFLYENEFTIYEGDWGKPYAARIEVWFRPDSGKPERKLLERICKIEGWQR